MRIGVLSDTHMPERAKQIPQKILEEFKNFYEQHYSNL